MFYKFNQLTQSIISATQGMSMGQFKSLRPVEPVDMTQVAKRAPKLESSVRHNQTSSSQQRVPNNPTYKKLMSMQTRFTAQDGLLVWQKMTLDMPLYYTVVVLVTVGFGLTVCSIATLATPPKNE